MENHHRRKRMATMPSSSVPDWSSLSPDLVSCIGDIFLATGDVDCYMSLREVCRTWRTATDDPRGPDPRFRPWGWTMLGRLENKALQGQAQESCRRLFVNVNTGRFLWKDMPLMPRGYSSYSYIGSDHSNGLLVLKVGRHSNICVLNPFTGYLVPLPPPWGKLDEALMVAAEGMRTKVLYTFWDSCHVVCNGYDPVVFLAPPDFDSSTTVVAFQSRAYAVGRTGTVMLMDEEVHTRLFKEQPSFNPYQIERALGRRGPTQRPFSTFLVDNAGELLLVRLRTSLETDSAMQVFRVDLEVKALHKITSIGNRAIFLGVQCLSVDAQNLPGIECNCIYYVGDRSKLTRGICMYHLEDGSHEKLCEYFASYIHRYPCRLDVAEVMSPAVCPFSLPQVLLDYPSYKPGQHCCGNTNWQY